MNLAVFDRLGGQDERAEERLDTVLGRDPTHIGARLNRAVAKLYENRAADVLALLNGPTQPTRPSRRSGTCRSSWPC